MTLEEKQLIAATARKLIRLLENCDDDAFCGFGGRLRSVKC